MKNFLSCVLALVILIGFICFIVGNNKGNITPATLQNMREAEVEIQKLRAEIEDKVFWESVGRAKKVIEETIECRKITVLVKLNCSDGKTICLEKEYNLRFDNEEYLKFASNSFIYDIATDEAVTKEHAAGETVKVVGIIYKWVMKKISTDRFFSVCDLDIDGKWDYVAEGEMYFTDAPNAVLSNPENEKEPLGIGLASIRPNSELIKIEKNEKLSKLAKAVG